MSSGGSGTTEVMARPWRLVTATSWSIAVSSKCRRPPDFYGLKDRPHYSTDQGPPLVACPRACQVPVMCVGVPVSSRHGTVVPRRRPGPLIATDVTSGLLTRQLWWSDLPDAQRSATVRFPWQLLRDGLRGLKPVVWWEVRNRHPQILSHALDRLRVKKWT